MIQGFSRIRRVLCKVGPQGKNAFLAGLRTALRVGRGGLLVTANPETLAHAQEEAYLRILEDQRTRICADGVGLLKMARAAGLSIQERIPGVDCMSGLLAMAADESWDVALLGARAVVLQELLRRLARTYPALRIVQAFDGYGPDKDEAMRAICAAEPRLLFVALGIPQQEILIHRYLDQLPHCLCVGVGGSFDVLSGCKKRAPLVFQRTGTEWLYRLLVEPGRLKRFITNNLLFYLRWKRACRQWKREEAAIGPET